MGSETNFPSKMPVFNDFLLFYYLFSGLGTKRSRVQVTSPQPKKRPSIKSTVPFLCQNIAFILTNSEKNDRIFDRVCLIIFSSQTFVTLSGAGGGDF